VVDDILEQSDAYRRGLRYGDEIVRFGDRDIGSANALKNALGTYPRNWRVPLVFRQDGQEYNRHVRMAGVHHEGELAALMESGPEDPGPPDGDEKPDVPKRPNLQTHKKKPKLPAAVEAYYEQRPGYANYWFNRYHQQRVWNAFLARGDFAQLGWPWTMQAHDKNGDEVVVRLGKDEGTITVASVGESSAKFGASLTESTSPPRSGGLLAAMHIWERLLLLGPRRFGEVYYLGTLPWGESGAEADCLVGTYGGVETRFYFDPAGGDMVGLEMQTADDRDPCEIYFSDIRPVDGRRLPHHWLIRHGDQTYADLTIDSYAWPVDQGAGDKEQPELTKPADSGEVRGR
jgi:hypothetical protein